MKFESLYDLGNYMMVDGDKSMKVVITSVRFRLASKGTLTMYECSWIHNGHNTEAWIEEWRLLPWEE